MHHPSFLIEVIVIFLHHVGIFCFTGHSTRAHRGFTVLDLLGPCAIRECNQRYHSRQVALLLTLGLEVRKRRLALWQMWFRWRTTIHFEPLWQFFYLWTQRLSFVGVSIRTSLVYCGTSKSTKWNFVVWNSVLKLAFINLKILKWLSHPHPPPHKISATVKLMVETKGLVLEGGFWCQCQDCYMWTSQLFPTRDFQLNLLVSIKILSFYREMWKCDPSENILPRDEFRRMDWGGAKIVVRLPCLVWRTNCEGKKTEREREERDGWKASSKNAVSENCKFRSVLLKVTISYRW